MKQYLLTFSVLAYLAGCGGSDATNPPALEIKAMLGTSATLPAARPSVRFSNGTVQLCTQPSGSPVSLCHAARQPRALGRVVYATAAHLGSLSHLGANEAVALNVDSHQQAWLCKYSPASTTCLPVAAPLPQNVDIKFWVMPDDYHVVTYAHRPNTNLVYDPDGRATRTFQAALEATATQLGAGRLMAGFISSNAQSTDDTPDCGMNTDQDNCGREDDDPDPDAPPPTGDGSDGGWSDGGWDWGSGWDSNGTPLAGLPTVEDDITSYATTSCSGAAIPGFLVFCIEGHRPPPMTDTMPLPTGPAPWLPQSWCDVASILCSNGQEPRSGPWGASPDRGKTLPQLLEQCSQELAVKIGICQIDHINRQDTERYLECMKNARTNYTTCEDNARALTGNGAHPAP